MRARRGFAIALLVAGCAAPQPSPPDVVGPFTGATRRFVIDAITLPTDKTMFADDLNGDGKSDNQLGNIVGVLAAQNLNPQNATDAVILSGVLASFVEITSDDPSLMNDSTVGVRYLGAESDTDDEMGATLVDGTIVSNRIRFTRAPARGTARLAIVRFADPSAIETSAFEIDLAADGKGGFNGVLHGAFATPSLYAAAYEALLQMYEADPVANSFFAGELDVEHDGMPNEADLFLDPVVRNVLSPDVQLFDGDKWSPNAANRTRDSLSFGVGVHLLPCANGDCALAKMVSCENRVRDGDETDVDCGGSCHACPGGERCTRASDCQTKQCNAGVCAQPTCSDGIQDGFESDVDCSGGCAKCRDGAKCWANLDCESAVCCFDSNPPTCNATCSCPATDYFCN